MYHTPQYKSAEELLLAVGFKRCEKSTDRGYEIKILDAPRKDCIVISPSKYARPKFDRIHAIVAHGYINMHVDENTGNKHVAHAGHHLVRAKMREIKKLDVADVNVRGIEYMHELLA